MNFNFKNKNSIIILLLILLIASVFCFFLMQKKVEPFLPGNVNFNKFKIIGQSLNSNYSDKYLYKLNDNNNKGYKLTGSSSGYQSYILPDISFTTNENTIFDNNLTTSTGSNIDFNMYKIVDVSLISSNNNDVSYNRYKLNNAAAVIALDLSSTLNDLSENVNILFLTDLSGKVYDLCNNHMTNLNIYLDGLPIINNGVLDGMTQTPTSPSVPIPGTTTATATATGGSVGDIINNIVTGDASYGNYPNLLKEYPYLLQYPSLLQSSDYFSPYYNSSFESMMSIPSDPLVNSNSAMNPLEYNQSLFGPNVTPMMAQKMCKNLNVDTKVSDTSNNNNNNMFNSNLTSGLTGNGSNGGGLTGGGSSTNGSNNMSADGTTNNHPPCPPCGRCPESNFECKKIPKYEQGYDNPVVPRAVLTDFSTFGM